LTAAFSGASRFSFSHGLGMKPVAPTLILFVHRHGDWDDKIVIKFDPTGITECVYQDSRGFIWFGMEHDCVCFDGHTFKKYLANKSLPINKIEENENGNIVIYGYYFIYILDVETDELRMTG
jgi:hypothetical protein